MSRRKIITLEAIRRVNKNRMDGHSVLVTANIPDSIKRNIQERHYSATEINASYARVMSNRNNRG